MSAVNTKSAPSKRKAPAKKGRGKELSSEDFQRILKPAVESAAGKTFTEVLQGCGLRSPLILFGTQHVRSKRIIDWLRESFFADQNQESASYFGSELTNKKSCEPIIQQLLSQSLFTKESLVIIYDSDSIKAPAVKELSEHLSRGSSSAVVILTAEDPEKKTSLAGTLGENSSRIVLSELSGPILLRWIEKEASRFGAKGFEPGAVQLLVQYFGSDTTLLTREIEKLALLTEPGALISSALVKQLSFQNPEVTSFELIQRIARKDVTGACVQALQLIDQGMHPMQISHFLNRCMRTILARRDAGAKEQLAAEFTNYWFTKNLSGLERSFSKSDARHVLQTLRELDFNLKDSKVGDRMALTLAVQKLAFENAGSSRAAQNKS